MTRMTKQERQRLKFECWQSMMLSKFCVEVMGLEPPYKYKFPFGKPDYGANYYPSDCLCHWEWAVFDKDDKRIEKYEDLFNPNVVKRLWVKGWLADDTTKEESYMLPENFLSEECNSSVW